MSSKLILLVDDDLDDTELFLEAVEQVDSGLKCVTASDGIEAINVLKSASTLPDLIFLDVNMPRMGGMEFLTKIKKLSHFKHIPVAMYSTAKTAEMESFAKSLGAAYYIMKPTTFDEIIFIITQVLNSISTVFNKI